MAARDLTNAYDATGNLIGYVTETFLHPERRMGVRYYAESLDGVRIRGIFVSFEKAQDALRKLYGS